MVIFFSNNKGIKVVPMYPAPPVMNIFLLMLNVFYNNQ